VWSVGGWDAIDVVFVPWPTPAFRAVPCGGVVAVNWPSALSLATAHTHRPAQAHLRGKEQWVGLGVWSAGEWVVVSAADPLLWRRVSLAVPRWPWGVDGDWHRVGVGGSIESFC
jgi:hypothetical protein